SLPRAPPEVQRSESVVQSELHLARAVEGVADAAERGGVDVEARVGSAGQVAEAVIRAGIKARMIQRIGGLESKLDGLAFGNLRDFGDVGVQVHGRRIVEHAALQRADGSGARIEEGLVGEDRLTFLCGSAVVARVDVRRVDEEGSLARHVEAHDIAELAGGEAGAGGILRGAGSGPVQCAALRENRERRARLPGEDAADVPSAGDAGDYGIARQKAVSRAERQLVSAVGMEDMPQVVSGAGALDLRVVDVEEGLEAA